MAYFLTFALHAMAWLVWHVRSFDAALSTSPPISTGLAILPFKLTIGIPWIVDIRDLWIDVSADLGFISEGGIVERLSRAYRLRELRTADLITVTTTETARILESEYDISTPVSVVPNGVDVDRFDRERTGTDPVVIYTGNVGHGQDLESCVRALQYVENDDVTLRIVGDGDRRDTLESLTAELGLTDRVEFVGFVNRDRIPSLLSEATIGIAPIKPDPSLRYAVPTKLYEYMACRLPSIAVGKGEIEAFVDASGGGRVAENDPQDIAETIDTLLADPSLRERLGSDGRAYVAANYDRRAIAEELGDRLDELVTDGHVATDR
jgi:glycosyltransferase involved in cell wall biosynthesis